MFELLYYTLSRFVNNYRQQKKRDEKAQRELNSKLGHGFGPYTRTSQAADNMYRMEGIINPGMNHASLYQGINIFCFFFRFCSFALNDGWVG